MESEVPYWLTDKVDPEAATHREMFAIYGRTVYFCQCFEKQLAIMKATMFNEKFGPAGLKERDSFFDIELQKTCGQILTELRKKIRIGTKLDERLKTALKQRNMLIHNYFWDRAKDLASTEGQIIIISEVREIGDSINKLDEELTVLHREWAKKAGVPDEVFENALKNYLSETA